MLKQIAGSNTLRRKYKILVPFFFQFMFALHFKLYDGFACNCATKPRVCLYLHMLHILGQTTERSFRCLCG